MIGWAAMSFEEKLDYKSYDFKFNEDEILTIKSIDEIKQINKVLKEESPESDYDSYSWYLSDEKAQELKYERLQAEMLISWHMGLPFYRLYRLGVVDGYRLEKVKDVVFSIAEFYLQKYERFKPDSEGLVLHNSFQNIPDAEGVHIHFRVPIKMEELDAAYEKSSTLMTGKESLIFLYDDVKNMSDDEVKLLARIYPRADMSHSMSINRKGDVVYASFGYHYITRLPDSERF